MSELTTFNELPQEVSRGSQPVRPLYSECAQRAMLGAALEDNSLMRGPLSVLSVSDLVGSRDQTIYALMLELSEDGEPFDPVVLAQMLEERGQLDQVGGGEYLGSLVDGAMPDPGLAKRHAEAIRRLSQLRRMQSVAETLGSEVNSFRADPEQLLERLVGAVQLLRSGHDLNGDLLPVGPRVVSRRPEILTLSAVESLEVDWLWPPYLANRMLAMLSGDPSAGKTYLTLAVAAALTLGREPYTNLPRNPADVLYLSVENSPEHVIRPRFDAFGGEASRFHILRGTLEGEGQSAVRGPIKLSDVGLLRDALKQTKARLVIVDPIQSYLGADVDAHRSNETRPVLDGLAQIAEEHGCCILLVRHLSKAQTGRAIHRGLGSIDLTGAVRTELFAGSSPDGQRALVQVKSNVGRFGPALGYTIEADGSFRWTGESALTAAALLAPETPEQDRSAAEEAMDFLQRTLSEGPRPAKVVQTGARLEGITERTLKRAKSQLRVVSRKLDMDGSWEWGLPGRSPDCPKRANKDAGPLRDSWPPSLVGASPERAGE